MHKAFHLSGHQVIYLMTRISPHNSIVFFVSIMLISALDFVTYCLLLVFGLIFQVFKVVDFIFFSFSYVSLSFHLISVFAVPHRFWSFVSLLSLFQRNLLDFLFDPAIIEEYAVLSPGVKSFSTSSSYNQSQSLWYCGLIECLI